MDLYNVFLMMSNNTEGATGGSNGWIQILLLVGMFALLYFVMIRPQKKREKTEAEMRDATQVGDEIITAGGIMGRVVTLKEDSLVIETGADRTKIRVTKTSILSNVTATQKQAASRQASIEAMKAQKEEKAEKKKKDKK